MFFIIFKVSFKKNIKKTDSIPVSASHILIVLLKLPLRTFFPSGEKDTDQTDLECPIKLFNSFSVSTSHIFTIVSLPPLTTFFPSESGNTDEFFLQYRRVTER